MSTHDPSSNAGAEPAPVDAAPRLADELKAIPFEPLLPVERKLIAASLLLGVSLLGLLYWIGVTYFPVTTP